MELDDVIQKRRSIRKFTEKPIEEEKIKKIIEAGVRAPSACNTQAWRFRILTAPEKIKLVDAGAADFLKQAPLGIVVTYPKTANNYRDEIESASACIQNMLLKATDLGIGSCWLCHLPSKWKVRRMLKIPRFYEVIACVVFGYAVRAPEPIKQKCTYDELFIFDKKTPRNLLKYLYTRQPFRPRIIERIYPKKFEN